MRQGVREAGLSWEAAQPSPGGVVATAGMERTEGFERTDAKTWCQMEERE